MNDELLQSFAVVFIVCLLNFSNNNSTSTTVNSLTTFSSTIDKASQLNASDNELCRKKSTFSHNSNPTSSLSLTLLKLCKTNELWTHLYNGHYRYLEHHEGLLYTNSKALLGQYIAFLLFSRSSDPFNHV